MTEPPQSEPTTLALDRSRIGEARVLLACSCLILGPVLAFSRSAMMECEKTLLKLELQLCAHCTSVGDGATLSLDIDKLRSRLLPEPRV